MSLFTIALAGRPNVGKSTLFNALCGKSMAIVANYPGVTIDYKETTIPWLGTQVRLIDTGGIVGGKTQAPLSSYIKEQALLGLEKAHVIALVVDGKEGLTAADKDIVLLLRKHNKPLILIVNKTDTKNAAQNKHEFSSLGLPTIQLSAAHRSGLAQLADLIEPLYSKYQKESKPQDSEGPSEEAPFLSVAIVGKPNVGKSTLINQLLQEPRLAVSDIAGTTRDSISTYLTYKGHLIRLLDTAGLKRKSKTATKLETLATSDTIRSIIFAQVVVLVIDATEGITKQDLNLASYINKEGRALIVAINKIDLVKDPKKLIARFQDQLDYEFSDIKKVTMVGISALENINTRKIFTEALKVYSKWSTSIKTSLLNRWLGVVLAAKPPALFKGRYVKIKFMTQAKVRPPTFNLWVNIKEGLTKQYLNFLRNKIYTDFKLWGVPIRFAIKHSANPFAGRRKTSPK